MTGHVLRRSAILLATALALSSSIHAQSGYELFQQALSKERAEGKLQEAIALYQRVVDVAATDHGLAAKALMQLGRCYETLGNTEARAAYERLIARYPDQADLVAQAKARLAAIVRTPAAPAAMTIQPLDLEDDELLAVSPDGSKAIVLNYSKGENLALLDFSKKQKRLLTDLDWSMGGADSPVWSPDVQRVAYVEWRRGTEGNELRTMTLDGRSSLVYRTERAQKIQPVGWTPDGRTLVVVMTRPDKTAAIGTLPATGGPFTPLRSLGWSYDTSYFSGAAPRLSPDGRFVAYLEGEAGQRDLHVVSLDGRAADRITDDPGDDFGPIWSPDSRYLAFTSTRLGGVSLWSLELKDGKPVGAPVKLKDGMQFTRTIAWSKRGISYRQPATTFDLYTVAMDPIEGRPTGSPRPIPYSRTGRNVSPAWSPDGKSFAFVSSAAAEPNRRYVVVMPADGRQAREFLIPTTAWRFPQSPYELRWFGDGRELGFAAIDARGARALFRLRLDTDEWNTIPLSVETDGMSRRTEWNRDGSAFYFARVLTNPGIFERAVNADAERLVYRSSSRVNLIQPLDLSPDRRWLAFQQWTFPDADTRTLTSAIVIVDVATGETRTVLEGLRNRTPISPPHLLGWTPSGDLLVWHRGTGNETFEFQLVPVNGNAPRSFAIPPWGPTLPGELAAAWSPDGRTMVLGRVGRGGGGTFVIENPLAAVRVTPASR